MAFAESTMLALGVEAPGFRLPDVVSGAWKTLGDLRSEKATVVMFICNHCPYVLFVNDEINRAVADYAPKGVSFVGISSNDAAAYPQDGPDKMKTHAAAVGYAFPYLYDETQDVARAYDAACTPDFFVFDGLMKLIYRGRLDDARPGNGKTTTGKDLRAALDAALEGKPVDPRQYPSAGCNIKWKKKS